MPAVRHEDPPGEGPWAMQLVVHAEKGRELYDYDVVEAAARAAVTLIASPAAAPGGPWAAAVERWSSGRIRKICRRGRGAQWRAAASLAGVTVRVRSAEVRAFVPGPTADLAPELDKLQVAGLVTVAGDHQGDPWGALAATGTVLVVAVNPGLEMTTGKLAAQAGHATHLAWVDAPPDRRRAWGLRGYPVVLTRPDGPTWAEFSEGADVSVTDGGFTEVPAGSTTVSARWPRGLAARY